MQECGDCAVQGTDFARLCFVVVPAQEMKLRADESGRYVLGVKRQLVQKPAEGKPSGQHENSSS
jgi:hypothetical protein